MRAVTVTDYAKYKCNTKNAIDLVGDKWTLFIIREFAYIRDNRGFNDLMRALKPISSRTLDLKLKRLESCGILKKKIIQERPKKVEYSLTEEGKRLEVALRSLGQWFKDCSCEKC
jgi:DNA-binding HxlR family transcriptional regulator